MQSTTFWLQTFADFLLFFSRLQTFQKNIFPKILISAWQLFQSLGKASFWLSIGYTIFVRSKKLHNKQNSVCILILKPCIFTTNNKKKQQINLQQEQEPTI